MQPKYVLYCAGFVGLNLLSHIVSPSLKTRLKESSSKHRLVNVRLWRERPMVR